MRIEASVACLNLENISTSENLTVLIVPSYSANDVDGYSDKIRNDSNIGTLWCICSRSGKVLWEYGCGGELKCRPVVDQSTHRVYMGSYDHYMYELDGKNGKLIVKYDCGGAIYSTSYLSKHNNQTILYIATIKGLVHLLDISSRQIKWSINVSSPIYASLLFISVANSNYLIVASIDSHIKKLDCVDGSIVVDKKLARKPIFSSPYLIKKNDSEYSVQSLTPIIIVASHDGFIRGISIHDFSLMWETDLQSITCTTAGDIYLLSAERGDIVSKIKISGEIYSSPVTYGRMIYVGARDDKLHAIEIS
jgi:outer membrane protein assembly factor BamB